MFDHLTLLVSFAAFPGFIFLLIWMLPLKVFSVQASVGKSYA